jgi:hypothetical protein
LNFCCFLYGAELFKILHLGTFLWTITTTLHSIFPKYRYLGPFSNFNAAIDQLFHLRFGWNFVERCFGPSRIQNFSNFRNKFYIFFTKKKLNTAIEQLFHLSIWMKLHNNLLWTIWYRKITVKRIEFMFARARQKAESHFQML